MLWFRSPKPVKGQKEQARNGRASIKGGEGEQGRLLRRGDSEAGE